MAYPEAKMGRDGHLQPRLDVHQSDPPSLLEKYNQVFGA